MLSRKARLLAARLAQNYAYNIRLMYSKHPAVKPRDEECSDEFYAAAGHGFEP